MACTSPGVLQRVAQDAGMPQRPITRGGFYTCATKGSATSNGFGGMHKPATSESGKACTL